MPSSPSLAPKLHSQSTLLEFESHLEPNSLLLEGSSTSSPPTRHHPFPSLLHQFSIPQMFVMESKTFPRLDTSMVQKRFFFGDLMETDANPDFDARLQGELHPPKGWSRPSRFIRNNPHELASLYGTIRRNNGCCSNPGQDDFLAELGHHQHRCRLHHNLFQQQQLDNISNDKTALFLNSSLSSWLLPPVHRASSELPRHCQGQPGGDVPQALFDIHLDLNRETNLRHGVLGLQVAPDDDGMMDG